MAEHDCFEKTALPHREALVTYALHLTMDTENAKDLLQDTYLNAYRYWHQFEQGTNIKAWLSRIMKNTFINRYRKEQKVPKHIGYEEYHLPYDAPDEPSLGHRPEPVRPYDEVFDDEIVQSIGTMNDTYRTVILLGKVEGLSYQEIALAVGCPLGTVRSRLHRGRSALKKKLFKYARDNGYIPKRSRP
jgi:RNA polymerase sigma-70 factor (ECF subfamily)